MDSMVSKNEVIEVIESWLSYYGRVIEVCKDLGNNDGPTCKDAISKSQLLVNIIDELEEL